MNPEHPIYIVSKGRADRQLTSIVLHEMGVRHFVIVEEQERAEYAAAANSSASLLVLDKAYQRDYETCDDLGETKSRGPGPARNFAWDHALRGGSARHWVMDDNIKMFMRLHRNLKTPVSDGTILRCMEDFVDRYTNVPMAGPNYFMFASRKSQPPPFVINTRIYSCNLIHNDAPYRWRGRYNEDTDLSLRMLKDGLCTIQFNAFLQYKTPTQQMPGGNTREFYLQEGTLPKSAMLVRLHPDVARLAWRFGRAHHYVDYSGFRQRLRRRADVIVGADTDDYGMVLQERRDREWVSL